jgi:small subunit ribosomal protein S6
VLNYETVVVIDGLLDEGAIESEIQKVEKFIKKGGGLQDTDKWGKRKLAYPIKRKTHGYYTRFLFEGDGKLISEMERGFRYNESVLRYLTVKLQ